MKEAKEKLRAYISVIIEKYFIIHQNKSLLEPAVYNEKIVKRYNSNSAGNGLEALRFALYIGAVSDIKTLLFDKDSRSASINNICEKLKNDQIVRTLRVDYCEPPRIRSIFCDGEPDSALKEKLENRFKQEEIERLEKEFDETLPKTLKMFDDLSKSDLAKRICEARDKAISHYEIKNVNGERKLNRVEDFRLTWGDLSELLDNTKNIIFNLNLVLRASSYDMESRLNFNEDISNSFWNIES